MSAEDTNALIEQRRSKLAALREHGIDPFANKFTPSECCAAAKANYAEDRGVALAGRLSALREMGKSLFFDIKDQSGRIQVYAKKQDVGDDNFKILQHLRPANARPAVPPLRSRSSRHAAECRG